MKILQAHDQLASNCELVDLLLFHIVSLYDNQSEDDYYLEESMVRMSHQIEPILINENNFD